MEGIRVSPLKLKVRPAASFWMQPWSFFWDGTLKTMLDQFVSERVLILDSSCDFASPLVNVNSKGGRICMSMDYH